MIQYVQDYITGGLMLVMVQCGRVKYVPSNMLEILSSFTQAILKYQSNNMEPERNTNISLFYCFSHSSFFCVVLFFIFFFGYAGTILASISTFNTNLEI